MAATVLSAKDADRIHLFTCLHSGLSNIENSHFHVPMFQKLYPETEFTHVVSDMDSLFRKVTYDRYLTNLRRFGFMNLTTCGLCKLAMHLRGLVYCLDNGIESVVDGANQNSSHFPAQMAEVLGELKTMYRRFGIKYENNVFEYDHPDGLGWLAKLGLEKVEVEDDFGNDGANITTGQLLYNEGILPEPNVKGTELDRRMQARCFQLTLLNTFALGYYIPRFGKEKYKEGVFAFYKEKISRFGDLVKGYQKNPKTSELSPLIRPCRKLEN